MRDDTQFTFGDVPEVAFARGLMSEVTRIEHIVRVILKCKQRLENRNTRK